MRRLLASTLISALAAQSSAQQISVCVDPVAAVPELAPALLVPIDVVLPAGATVTAVSVELTLTHPWVGDLVVTLDKGGAQSVLLDRLSLGTYPFGCGGKDIDAVFTDGAITTPESLCMPGPAPVLTGDLTPATPLSIFEGSQAGGVWTLSVLDAQHFDVGQVDRVCLTIGYAVPACSPADLAAPFGVLDDADVSAYLAGFESGDPAADIAEPLGQLDFFDVLAFLDLFDAGCP